MAERSTATLPTGRPRVPPPGEKATRIAERLLFTHLALSRDIARGRGVGPARLRKAKAS
jgi:hypothetical protein